MMKDIEMNNPFPKFHAKQVFRVVVKQVVKLYRASNRYFFGDDEISLHDFCWYYGSLIFMCSLYFLVQLFLLLV